MKTQTEKTSEEQKFRKFRDKIFEINLKKVQGVKLTSNDYRLLRIWKEINKILKQRGKD